MDDLAGPDDLVDGEWKSEGEMMDVTEAEYRYLAAIEIASAASELARTKDISRYLGVAPATVTGMLKKLSAKGLVAYRPYRGASLTTPGLKFAKLGRDRVFVLERFFRMVGMSEEGARRQAREMGPAISDESYRRLVQLVIRRELGIKVEREPDGTSRVIAEGPFSS